MHKFMFTLVLIPLLSVYISGQELLNDLDELKWKNRIIVILTNDDSSVKNFRNELTSEKEGILDRDIIYYIITPAQTITNSDNKLSSEIRSELVEDYFDSSESIKVILIGKDGGIKMETNSFDLKNIFRRIDSMPMRIQEMKKK